MVNASLGMFDQKPLTAGIPPVGLDPVCLRFTPLTIQGDPEVSKQQDSGTHDTNRQGGTLRLSRKNDFS